MHGFVDTPVPLTEFERQRGHGRGLGGRDLPVPPRTRESTGEATAKTDTDMEERRLGVRLLADQEMGRDGTEEGHIHVSLARPRA